MKQVRIFKLRLSGKSSKNDELDKFISEENVLDIRFSASQFGLFVMVYIEGGN